MAVLDTAAVDAALARVMAWARDGGRDREDPHRARTSPTRCLRQRRGRAGRGDGPPPRHRHPLEHRDAAAVDPLRRRAHPPRPRPGPAHRRPGRTACASSARHSTCRFRYVPVRTRSTGRPHVIVDGAPRPGTVVHAVALAGHTDARSSCWPTSRPGSSCGRWPAPTCFPRRRRGHRSTTTTPTASSRWPCSCVDGLADAHGAAARRGGPGRRLRRRHRPPRRARGLRPGRAGRRRAHAVPSCAAPAPSTMPATCAPGRHRGAARSCPRWSTDPEALPRPCGRDEAAAFDASRAGPGGRMGTIEEHPRRRPGRRPASTPRHPDAPGPRVGRARPLHPRRGPHAPPTCLRVATIAGGRRRGLATATSPGSGSSTRRPRPRVDLDGAGRASSPAAESGAAPLGLRRRRRHHRRPAPRRGREHPRPRATSSTAWCETAASSLDAGPPAWDPYAAAWRSAEPVPGRAQATGRSHIGNQRVRSGSTGRSSPSMPRRRSSSSLSRCSLPVGAKG